MATEADIFEAMKQVEDPELGVNVVDLGLVYGVDQEDDGHKVRLDMTLTTVACPLTDMIERDQRRPGRPGRHPGGRDQLGLVASLGPQRLTEDGKGGPAFHGLCDLTRN